MLTNLVFFIFYICLHDIINSAVTCDGDVPQKTQGLGIGNEYLCSPNDFTLTRYASSQSTPNGLHNPRVMSSTVYNGSLITYVGSIHDWSVSTGTTVKAMIDVDMDGVIDYVVDAFTAAPQEFNVATVDPITGYLHITSQEKMYLCTNMNEFVMDKALGNNNINDGSCVIYKSYPTNANDATHARHYAAFPYPDYNDLCVAFGADCDNCVSNELPRTTILCYNMTILRNINSPTQQQIDDAARTVAFGVRNSVGFDWHPITQDLWFTDNGANDIYSNSNPQWKSDSPDDELNVIVKGNEGGHYGFPYQHTIGLGNWFHRDINNVSYYNDVAWYSMKPPNTELILPKQAMGPHTAVLGIKFYNRNELIANNCKKGIKTNLFPEKYNNIAFIAKHGSWAGGYSIVSGYKVVAMNISIPNNDIIGYSDFIIGFAEERSCNTACDSNAWSRPAFIEILPDGSMLLSDDLNDYVFRIEYTGSDAQDYDCPTIEPSIAPSETPTDTPSRTPTSSPTTTPIKANGTSSPSVVPSESPIYSNITTTFFDNQSNIGYYHIWHCILISIIFVIVFA